MGRRLLQGRPPFRVRWPPTDLALTVLWVLAMLLAGGGMIYGGVLEDRAYRNETPAEREAHIQGAGGR